MNVDLAGRSVRLAGAGPLADHLAEALAANGATLAAAKGDADALVLVSDGAIRPSEDLPAETVDFAAAIRGAAERIDVAVVVMSCAALVPVRGLAAFSALQAGLERMTRALAMELGPRVRVNGVAVGAIAGSVGTERLVGHTALRRPGEPAAVAAAVLFLLDPDNTYMTGHTLAVDGGWAVGYARDF